MKCEDPKVGGFPPPSDGWHGCTIGDCKYETIKGTKKNEKGEDETYKVVNATFIISDGSDEDGRRIFAPRMFMTNPGNRTDFAKIIYYSKTDKVVEKNYKIPPKDADLDVAKWAEKYCDVQNPQCEKLIDGACNLMHERTIDVYTKTEPDRKGVIRCTPKFFFFYGEGRESGIEGGTAPASKPARKLNVAASSAASASVAAEPTQAPPQEEEGWPES